MKKKLLVSTILALTTGMAFAQAPAPAPAQGQLSTTVLTTTTATGAGRTTSLKPRAPAAASLVPTGGVGQVAIRQGSPVQLINPVAPARYGNGQEHVMHDPNDPGKPKGISLFAWSFW